MPYPGIEEALHMLVLEIVLVSDNTKGLPDYVFQRTEGDLREVVERFKKSADTQWEALGAAV